MSNGYRVLDAGLKQTAVNAAANITAAAIGAGMVPTDDVQDYFEDFKEDIFKDLQETAAEDNKALAEQEASEPAPSKSTGSKGRAKGKGQSGGGNKGFTYEEACAIVLKFGAFEDMTLGDLWDLSAEDADKDYGHTNGNGREYVEWLSNRPPQDPNKTFVKDAATAVVEGARAKSAA